MPPAKTKTAPANGSTSNAPKGKQGKAAAKSAATPAESSSAVPSGTVTPATVAEETIAKGEGSRAGRPDRAMYDAEQEKVKAEIEVKQAEKSKIDEQIRSLTSGGPSGDRRQALLAELNELRSQRKNSRSSILEQLKVVKERMKKRRDDLQAAKSKLNFKTVQDVDAHIKHLDKQVDAGTMTVANEKRALAEITASKRLRRTLESLQADQDAIDKDKATADELGNQLDDPELKAADDRMSAISLELDQIKKDGDELYGNKRKLHDRSRELKGELDDLFKKKRDSAQTFKDSNDRYYTKMREDQARRHEKFVAQKKAEEDTKKKEVALRLREEAEAPAYQVEIEDCQTLIDFLSGKGSGIKEPLASVSKVALVGVPELELRQVEAKPDKGFTTMKKKGDDDETYFVGKKGKSKGRKGGVKSNGVAAEAADGDAAPSTPSSDKLNVPLPTLKALLQLAIPPPSSPADVPRTIEDLKKKKAWFEANQERVTADNIAKAEANIQKLMNGSATKDNDDPTAEVLPPNGTGEKPAEPAPTPQVTETLSNGVESEKVDEVLDDIQSVQKEVEAEA